MCIDDELLSLYNYRTLVFDASCQFVHSSKSNLKSGNLCIEAITHNTFEALAVDKHILCKEIIKERSEFEFRESRSKNPCKLIPYHSLDTFKSFIALYTISHVQETLTAPSTPSLSDWGGSDHRWYHDNGFIWK